MVSLDILIPTYNEEELLPGCLESLSIAVKELNDTAEIRTPVSIYVVDASSSDSTVEIARSYGVHIIEAKERGRGSQLADGFECGAGSHVLMLHADSTIAPRGLREFVEACTASSGDSWGALGHSYDSHSPRFRWVQMSNYLRFLLLNVAFGDQGMFARRSTLIAAGGIPRLRLMEDVELSLRLRRLARGRLLNGSLSVSARRWQKLGSLRYTLQVLSLVSRFITLRALGANLRTMTDRMYEEYYGVS